MCKTSVTGLSFSENGGMRETLASLGIDRKGMLERLFSGRGGSTRERRRRPASRRIFGGRQCVGGWIVGHGSSISAGIPQSGRRELAHQFQGFSAPQFRLA